MAQLMPLPLAVSCFSKIQIGFTFLVLAHPGSPGKRAVKRVYVCMYVLVAMAQSLSGGIAIRYNVLLESRSIFVMISCFHIPVMSVSDNQEIVCRYGVCSS